MPAPQVTPTEGAAALSDLNADLTALYDKTDAHEARSDNPHGVTAAQVGAATLADLEGKADALTEDEATIYPVVWQGPDGRLHGYIDDDGRMTAVSFRALDTSTFGEDAPRYEPLIEGAGGDLRVGWDNGLDGGLVALPSVQMAGAVLERVPPQTLRSGQVAFGVREDGAFRHGIVAQRGGYMAEVTELKNGFAPFALIRSPAPLEICCTMGQSNAGTGGVVGGNPRKQWGAVYPNALATFATIDGAQVPMTGSATSEADLSDLVDLASWRDSPSGTGIPQSQGIMIGVGLVSAFRVRGDLSPGVLGHVDWFGGQPIGTFIKGQPTYENLINHHAKFAELAARYGRTVNASAVHYIQGENPTAGYEAILDQLCTDLRADIATATGQPTPPVVLVAQINDYDESGAPSTIALEQLAVALSRPTEVKISGPMYQGRFAVGDNIHIDAESRFIFGEAAGDVHRRLVTGDGWDTFAFTAVRTGAVIDLTYKVNGMELSFDPGVGEPDGWVKTVPNQGFGYSDDSSGATISSVEIIPGAVGRLDTIRITLSADPGAATNKVLTYARNAAGDTTVDRWSGSRGMVRCRSHRSVFADMGFNIPAHVYHYAVQQEVSV